MRAKKRRTVKPEKNGKRKDKKKIINYPLPVKGWRWTPKTEQCAEL
jgi:hypothetical protein